MIRASRAALAAASAAAVVLGTSVGLAGAAVATPSRTAAQGRTTLPGSQPAWATQSRRVAGSSASTTVDFDVFLPWRNEAGAERYALHASTQGSADSGKFLTTKQFDAKYAPTGTQVAEVKSWLRSKGFRVVAVPRDHHYIEARGSLGQAATAFQTSFARYRVDGRTLRANTSPLSVPANLGIEGITGLDDTYALVHPDATPPPAGFRNAGPCSSYWGEKTVATDPTPDGTTLPGDPADYAPCGYAGAQLQGAYGMTDAIQSGDDGSGVTVAIVDAYASPTIESDANTYFSRHGLPTFAQGQFSQIVAPGTYQRPENPKQDPQGWAGEETLDVEAVHTMAPGANVLYYGTPNNYQDMDAALNQIVQGHLADIVTNSYGFSTEQLPSGYLKPFNDTLIQAAAEGISVFFSSGDDADETGGVAGATPTPDWPASSPWVTAVGGTSMAIGQQDNRLWEQGWETSKSKLVNGQWSTPSFLYGSGGGTSRKFPEPAYQQSALPGASGRTVPDVSALGDPNTGMLVGETQQFSDGSYYDEYRIGGTSLASPLYAGMFALAVQKAGHDFGLANPDLYANAAVSNDITTMPSTPQTDGVVRSDFVNGENANDGYSYTARWIDTDQSLTIHVRNGYDDVTGLGTPNGQTWLDAISGYTG